MISQYLNYDHGLELEKGNTDGRRGNENGILYLAEYYILKDIFGEPLTLDDRNDFERIVEGLTVVPGLYDRGTSDKLVENPKRTISHDNISGIASASTLLGTSENFDIVDYGLLHFFVYNNNQKGFDLPMNPGNYSPWLAMANIFIILEIFFLPFFVINYIISMSKEKEDTSSKILYLVELYPLRNSKRFWWGLLYKNYLKRLEKQYGEKYFREIFAIYFKDPDHPINVLARSL